MAIGDPYVPLPEMKHYMGIDTTNINEDTKLGWALASTTAGINLICGRQFNKAGAVTQRRYHTKSCDWATVADFHTETGLVIATDDDGDGVFETVWSPSDYELEPLDGIVDDQPGWPWWKIHAVGSRRFPSRNRRASLRVATDWGWATVPEPVKTACRIVAEETWKLKDAPFGVAGFEEFGVMRVRESTIAMSKISKYQRYPVLVA